MTIAGLGIARAAASALAMMVACGISSAFRLRLGDRCCASEPKRRPVQHRSPNRQHQSRCRPTSWKFWWRVSRSTRTSSSPLISEASLYPLQIVEAARFLDKLEKDKT